MKYRILHRTSYAYASPVTISHHVARLEPRTTSKQSRTSFSLGIDPEPAIRQTRPDYFGNQLCCFSLQEVHSQLEVVSESVVALTSPAPANAESSQPWDQVAALFRDPVSPEVVEPFEFVFDSPQVRASIELADYARESFAEGTPLLVGALDLTRRIHRDFKYDAKATTIATPLEEVLERRRGVCQDFAHLGIACLRSIGLPARYVSGYLRTYAPRGRKKLVGADASHAWLSLFCPAHGWIDFDPTNNLMPREEHVTVAYGRDFGDVSPFSGILTGGGQHEVKVAVDVVPVEDKT